VMDTVVRRLRPPFRLAKFEGDAAFMYAVCMRSPTRWTDRSSRTQSSRPISPFASGSATSSCRLPASAAPAGDMQRLDLKFVCHHGEFIKHKMAGREELAGRDVILVHRLLKNAVNERLGAHAYALYSDSCVQTMSIDPNAQGLVEHKESIDVLGEVKCWVRDLEEAWTNENDRNRNEVARDKSLTVIESNIAAPRPTVWEYFIMPSQRPKWRAADEVRETLASGRRGVGTINHCMHGPDVFVEEAIGVPSTI